MENVLIASPLCLCRAKYFRGKKLNGEYEIRVEQVCLSPAFTHPFRIVRTKNTSVF